MKFQGSRECKNCKHCNADPDVPLDKLLCFHPVMVNVWPKGRPVKDTRFYGAFCGPFGERFQQR